MLFLILFVVVVRLAKYYARMTRNMGWIRQCVRDVQDSECLTISPPYRMRSTQIINITM